MFDRFDRLLAPVRLPSERQLNRAQVAAGWAKVLVVERRGAWDICGGMHVRS